MSTKVHLLVQLSIHEGKIDDFQKIGEEMVALTGNEPGSLAYEWCLSSGRRRCLVVEMYQHDDAVMTHLNGSVVKDLLPKLLQHARIDRLEVFGNPSPNVAALLSGFGAEIFPLWRGLGR